MAMKRIILFLGIAALFGACRERFEAEQAYKLNNILVVEGSINVGDGITRIKLSRVTPLNTASTFVAETNAVVTIEDDDGSIYPLQNKTNGVYESGELNLGTDKHYRLRVEADEQVFVSEYTEPVITPRIDNVNWTRTEDNNLNITLSTHDPANETFYYKWEYEEVWETRTAYRSSWAYENGVARIRTSDEIKAMSTCWPRRRNSDLLMATSSALATDAITDFPLRTFPVTDVRLGFRYALTVTQRALTADEYEFLQVMKRNTNDLGGFFDSQPSQLIGNIRCETSNAPVVGFIGSYSSQVKLLIIKHSQVSDFDYTPQCPLGILNAFFEDPQFTLYLENALPTIPIYGPFVDDAAPIVGFELVPNTCADCRITSGTAPKPDFWVAEDGGEVE